MPFPDDHETLRSLKAGLLRRGFGQGYMKLLAGSFSNLVVQCAGPDIETRGSHHHESPAVMT